MLNVLMFCPPKSISYRFAINKGKSKIDLSKRHFLQAGAAGITGLALVKTAAVSRNHIGQAIRPPGALEENQFLDRCIRCHECTKICSSTGSCLQPAVIEAGVEGFWTPVSKPRLGYCEYNCNLCGQVCPLWCHTKTRFRGKKKILKWALLFLTKADVYPGIKNEDCLVCEEHCPTPDKAIKFDNRQVVLPNGQTKVVKFPYVDETLCIGCGICENKCPVVGKTRCFLSLLPVKFVLTLIKKMLNFHLKRISCKIILGFNLVLSIFEKWMKSFASFIKNIVPYSKFKEAKIWTDFYDKDVPDEIYIPDMTINDIWDATVKKISYQSCAYLFWQEYIISLFG